jgi:dihydroorotate dehydrogenase electron transfer subunit
MPQYQEKSVVVALEHLSESYFRLILKAPAIAASAQPGQFVMVACGPTLDPLLRRPFSIHRSPKDGTIHLLIKVVGTGTQLLFQLQPGDIVDLLGPLGRGFHFQPELTSCLVGGGVGIAPLLFLVEQFAPLPLDHQPPQVFLGGRTGADVAQLGKDFARLGCGVTIATEDGSLGQHGLITEPLAHVINRFGKAYICGPMAMMAAAATLCRQAGVACEVSLEAHMACGLGACLGCTVHRSDGQYLHVCKHGPVVPAEEVAWKA